MKKWKLLILFLWIFILIFPVLFGYFNTSNEYQFGGLIFNPIDGYSYFAKMQQGYSGEWAFQLPYSPKANNDIFIFTLYIFFGHISRILGVSIPFVFHFFRILFSVLLFFSLSTLLEKIFKDDDIFYKGALISLLFGGGLGWIYFITGDLPVDFWVAEAFVFLSAFSTPHFSLTILLMSLFAIFIIEKKKYPITNLMVFFMSIVLVSISPFASIIIGIIYGIDIILRKELSKEKFIPFIIYGFPAVIIGVYQFVKIRSDQVLNIWNSQNVTTTPSILNLFITFLPFLAGSIIIIISIRKKINTLDHPIKLFISWIIIAFILAYVPFNLQRRFLVGIYIPLVIIFWYFLKEYLRENQKPKSKLLIGLLVFIVLPSNMLIFSGSVNAIKNFDKYFYIKNSLIESLNWANTNVDSKSIFLSNEEQGLLIPAYGNFKVVYGHPFESINAEVVRKEVEKFWTKKMSQELSFEFIKNNHVDFILCNYDNLISDCPSITQSMTKLYDLNKIAIFQVSN